MPPHLELLREFYQQGVASGALGENSCDYLLEEAPKWA
jgi:hypothetical protein